MVEINYISGGGEMIYLLKFGASFLLPPGIFFVCLWILAAYLWRIGRSVSQRRAAAAIFAVTTVFYLLSTSWAADALMSRLESVYDQPAHPQGDVIVMLGGGATVDTPSFGEKGNLTAIPSARLLAAVELYNQLHVPVLVSGGQVYKDSGPEAEIAKRELLRLGVPENMIFTEPNSLNTRQNAIYSSEIMREQGFEHPVLVTSAFHIERSVENFQKEGFQVLPFPTDYHVSRKQVFHYNKLMPQSSALDESVTVMREQLRLAVTRYLE